MIIYKILKNNKVYCTTSVQYSPDMEKAIKKGGYKIIKKEVDSK